MNDFYIGMEIYEIIGGRKPYIEPYRITCDDFISNYELYCPNKYIGVCSIRTVDIGVIVFFDYADAEKKLKEMVNNAENSNIDK